MQLICFCVQQQFVQAVADELGLCGEVWHGESGFGKARYVTVWRG